MTPKRANHSTLLESSIPPSSPGASPVSNNLSRWRLFGRCDLEDQDIFRRLHIPQGVTWGDHLSDWADTAGKEKYLVSHSIKAVPGKSNTHVL
jgi:hypothetical protein